MSLVGQKRKFSFNENSNKAAGEPPNKISVLECFDTVTTSIHFDGSVLTVRRLLHVKYKEYNNRRKEANLKPIKCVKSITTVI
jgi:hypothetical protein